MRRRWQALTGEPQRCPLHELPRNPPSKLACGWAPRVAPPDRWVRGRWGTAWGRAFAAVWFGPAEATRWRWPWQPRTCSFCGAVHPDDAVRLRREGWRLLGSGELHKRFLTPPASWVPSPAAKVYLGHTTHGQYRELVTRGPVTPAPRCAPLVAISAETPA
jgi:hypothetical protein